MQSFWKESFKSTAKLLKGTADKVFSIVVYSRKQRILKKKKMFPILVILIYVAWKTSWNNKKTLYPEIAALVQTIEKVLIY